MSARTCPSLAPASRQLVRCSAVPAAASSSSSSSSRRSALFASLALVAVSSPLSASAKVECSLLGKVPCMPAPKDGKPRYDMPHAIYDPAKLATERALAKLAASSGGA